MTAKVTRGLNAGMQDFRRVVGIRSSVHVEGLTFSLPQRHLDASRERLGVTLVVGLVWGGRMGPNE